MALRHVLRLVVLRCRSNDFKELEIVVLQHELGIILRRQTTRPAMTTLDRLFLAAATGGERLHVRPGASADLVRAVVTALRSPC